MNRTYTFHGTDKNACKIVVRKFEGKVSAGTPRHI
jgi:hypothetical protein